MKNTDILRTVGELLSVSAMDAEKALCSRVVAAKGEVVQKGHTAEQACTGRDAFAKVGGLPIDNWSDGPEPVNCVVGSVGTFEPPKYVTAPYSAYTSNKLKVTSVILALNVKQ